MSWLFGKKKKEPKIPFPEGQKVDAGTLRFSSPSAKEKVIEPEKVKEAVGVEKPLAFPLPEEELTPPPMKEEELKLPPVFSKPEPSKELQEKPFIPPMSVDEGPLFIKNDVYMEVLTKIDDLKTDISHLKHANLMLQQSEFNEANNFEKLKRSMKNVHDRLLQVDKTLFKFQG